jgi:hypothetical protein
VGNGTANFELLRINLAIDEPPGTGETSAAEAELDGAFGNNLRYV